jgi:hypothetical protein
MQLPIPLELPRLSLLLTSSLSRPLLLLVKFSTLTSLIIVVFNIVFINVISLIILILVIIIIILINDVTIVPAPSFNHLQPVPAPVQRRNPPEYRATTD